MCSRPLGLMPFELEEIDSGLDSDAQRKAWLYKQIAGGLRPTFACPTPQPMQELVALMWMDDQSKRPDMTEVCTTVTLVLSTLRTSADTFEF